MKRLPSRPHPREQQFAGLLGLIVATSKSGALWFAELSGAGTEGTPAGGIPTLCAITVALPNKRPMPILILIAGTKPF